MTYSIVARDPETGELGVAVQSHWFSVGSVVPWTAPGIGAVATQSVAEVSYGPRGLELMGQGASPEEALDRLLAEDSRAAFRQVAMIDAKGRTATHTGECCVGFAGHAARAGVSCQANMMRSEQVWPDMLQAYEASSGARTPLAERLLAALDAAEAAGGDARGRQSAAIIVAPPAGESWRTSVRLHVEDHSAPLPELRRLLTLHNAYTLAGEADELSAAERHQEAASLYAEAAKMTPGNVELQFWAGMGAAQAGDLDRAVSDVEAAIAAEPGWRDLLERLPPALAPSAEAVRRELARRDPPVA